MPEVKVIKNPRKKPVRRPTLFSESFMKALGAIGREMEPLTDGEKRGIVTVLQGQVGQGCEEE